MNKGQQQVDSAMWAFLMKGGQQGSLEQLEENVNLLIKAATQKSAGQRNGDEQKRRVNYDDLHMIFMSVVCEAVALVLDKDFNKLKEFYKKGE